MDTICNELLQFMQLSTRLELKLTATKNVLALTASPEGRKFLVDNKALLEAIFTLTKDEYPLVAKDCYLSLVNLTTEEQITKTIVEDYNIIPEFMNVICDPNSQFSDKACMIISNITRTALGSNQCMKAFHNMRTISMNTLLDVFCNTKYNKMCCSLEYLGSLFANVTQTPEGRSFFLDHEKNNISKLLAFLQYQDSTIRRGAVATVLRNCCFNYECHDWLLGDEVDLLSHLLLPLAGPEEFTEEETEKLPLDLQYLPSDKAREPDEDIRRLLIESVLLLCAGKSGRKLVISRNTYLIIRELHKWETKNDVQSNVEACEKLIQVLISDEPGIGNLMTYEIPEQHAKLLTETLEN